MQKKEIFSFILGISLIKPQSEDSDKSSIISFNLFSALITFMNFLHSGIFSKNFLL